MSNLQKIFFKRIRKNKIVIPRTAFQKNYILAYKFKKKKLNFQDKITKLIELSKIKLENKIDYDTRRSKTHPIKKKCYCCDNTAFYQHHIITLINGGCDNGINRIPICFECHKLIHNWLFI